MIDGFITLHRKIFEWQWYQHPVHSRLFFHCLLKANFKTRKKGRTIIKRGSFVTSCQILADELGYTKKTVLNALRDLELTNELKRKTSNLGTMITICNYSDYQDIGVKNTPPATPPATPPSKRQVSTKNKDNKETKKQYNYSNYFVALFKDDEIVSWLKETGNKKIHDALLSEYNKDFLIKEINNAFYWQQENKKRKAGTFLKGWCDRSNDPNKINKDQKLRELDEDLIKKLDEGFFDVCEQD